VRTVEVPAMQMDVTMTLPKKACLIIELSQSTYDLDDYNQAMVNSVELGHRLNLAIFGEIEDYHCFNFILTVKDRLVLRSGQKIMLFLRDDM
jgi:hypothetical protein